MCSFCLENTSRLPTCIAALYFLLSQAAQWPRKGIPAPMRLHPFYGMVFVDIRCYSNYFGRDILVGQTVCTGHSFRIRQVGAAQTAVHVVCVRLGGA